MGAFELLFLDKEGEVIDCRRPARKVIEVIGMNRGGGGPGMEEVCVGGGKVAV